MKKALNVVKHLGLNFYLVKQKIIFSLLHNLHL